jgi:predicted dehydrogenase
MRLLIYGAGKIYWDYYHPRISRIGNLKDLIIVDPRVRFKRTPIGKFDAALILSPPEFHFDNINNFLKYSSVGSIVIIEKPALISTWQTQKIISIFKECQISGFFATPLRATYLYDSLKKLIHYKSKLKIHVSKVDLRNGFINKWERRSIHEDKYSTLIWDLGPHIFDFIISILNPSEIEALSRFEITDTRLYGSLKLDETECTFLLSQTENIPGFSRISFSDNTEYYFDFSNVNSSIIPSAHNFSKNHIEYQLKSEFNSSGDIDLIRTLTKKLETNSFSVIEEAVRSISVIEKLANG